MSINNTIAKQVAGAVRAIAQAGSASLGADCIWHAMACLHLLEQEGITEARLVAGHAAWRVHGKAPSAVVCHHADMNGVILDPSSGNVLFHAWVAHGDQVFDATTYQLREKLAGLDAFDGGRTPVNWCPDYLLVSRRECASWPSVRDGFHHGLFCYDPVPDLTERVLAHPDSHLDQYAIGLLDQAYQALKRGERLMVHGPCGSGVIA